MQTQQQILLSDSSNSLGTKHREICACTHPAGWGPLSQFYDGFTECFIDAAFIGLPAVILIILGTQQIVALCSKGKVYDRPRNWHFYAKLTTVSVAFVLVLVHLSIVLRKQSLPLYDVSVEANIAHALALVVAFVLHFVEHSRSRIANGVLLFYWLFSSLFSFLRIYALSCDPEYGSNLDITLVESFYALTSCIALVLEWLVPMSKSSFDIEWEQTNHNPIEDANIFSRLTFDWITPLMKLGYKSYLTEQDLPDIARRDKMETVVPEFEKFWKIEERKKKPSLTLALARAFGGPFLIGGCFKMVQDCLIFAQPQLLRKLIRFVDSYQSDDPEPVFQGVIIAVGMVCVSLTQTATLHQYFQRAFETGMRIRSGLTGLIYAKAMNLSNDGKANKSTGDIVNLMSVDTQRLQDLCQYGQTIWSGPFQIVLCLISLHGLLGNSMWAGVVVMVIMIPVNGIIASKQKKLQQKQMKNKDARTRLTTEIFSNVKSIKLYAWEVPFMEKLRYVRNNLELKNLKKMGILSAVGNFLWTCSPFLVSCGTFGIFVLVGDRPLTTDIVFPSLALFNLLGFPLSALPMVITALVEASVAITRLTDLFTSDELQVDAVTYKERVNTLGKETVTIKNGTFCWRRYPEYKISLQKINFVARKGELTCIVGRVGSGKSAVLQAMLGNLYKADGTVIIHGEVAYVPQLPWIMNASVRDNILFGKKLDPDFYHRTLSACALVEDLRALPDGDETQVGEKGISLSGGQKARLSLARAVYSRADVYVMDDILSAVDQHVGRHLIDNVLGPHSLLNTKTRILTTNAINVLSISSNIYLMLDGRISETGSYSDIMSKRDNNSKLYRLIEEFGHAGQSSSSSAPSLSPPISSDEKDSESNEELKEKLTELPEIPAHGHHNRKNSMSSLRRASTASLSRPKIIDEETGRQTAIKKEHSEQGAVKWNIYMAYAKSSNLHGVIAFLLLMVLSQGLSVLGNVWLKRWSEANSKAGENPHVGMYLGVYFGLGVGSSLLTLAYVIVLWVYCTISSASKLHDGMAQAVISCPMSFFETTPLGRIINRFSQDVYRVDEVLSRVFSMFFNNAVKVMFTLVVITWSTPLFILFIIPLGYIYFYYQRYYLRTSRELKRLSSVTRSPIYANFQESLGGISTIRAFNQERRFISNNYFLVDLNQGAYFPTVSSNRWLAVRLETVGSTIIFCSAILSVVSAAKAHISAGAVGLAMSYALNITQSLNWIVRMTVEVETNIVSVERILEYTNLPSEAPAIIPNHRPPASWPAKGEVRFNHYSARYRPNLELVLKDICLHVKPREKVGIVGRTGAGKSSLTMALFRMIEPADGSITIDDLNISRIGLRDLRQRLAIIPQDSQAFLGTIRDNLDPAGVHDDTDLWQVLELSHLKDHVSAMGGLSAAVAEAGSNLSAGQRQLMCLARALLTPSNILVLDEATAAVDVETDQFLQKTIRTEFKNRTILTIAHRLNTIMDSDRVVVLSNGQVEEFDTPKNLLANPKSLFYSLCEEGGNIEAASSKISEVNDND